MKASGRSLPTPLWFILPAASESRPSLLWIGAIFPFIEQAANVPFAFFRRWASRAAGNISRKRSRPKTNGRELLQIFLGGIVEKAEPQRQIRAAEVAGQRRKRVGGSNAAPSRAIEGNVARRCH